MTKMRREYARLPVTFSANTCESVAIDLREFHSLQVGVGAAWTAAALGIKVSPTETGSYIPLYQEVSHTCGASVPVQISSVQADRAYYFPEAVGGAGFLRLWSQDGSGANEDQTAERTLQVTMKG